VFFAQERPRALVWRSFGLLCAGASLGIGLEVVCVACKVPCRVSVPFGHERLPILFLRWFQSSLRRSVLGHGFEGRFPVLGGTSLLRHWFGGRYIIVCECVFLGIGLEVVLVALVRERPRASDWRSFQILCA